jgi:hypothetical protein
MKPLFLIKFVILIFLNMAQNNISNPELDALYVKLNHLDSKIERLLKQGRNDEKINSDRSLLLDRIFEIRNNERSI